MEKNYFTFGVGHKHCGYYVLIEGESSKAREKMFELFRRKWSFQYNEECWVNAEGQTQAEKYRYKLLKHIIL